MAFFTVHALCVLRHAPVLFSCTIYYDDYRIKTRRNYLLPDSKPTDNSTRIEKR